MDLYMAVPATLALVWIVYKVLFRNAVDPQTPPCLPTLPLVGSLPFLIGQGDIHLVLTEKGKRYGPVFAFYTGSRYTIVLNGYEALHEALVKKATDFAGRRTAYAERTVTNVDCRGITFKPYGDEFKRNRFLSVTVLKQFGFGDRKIMETIIHAEIAHQHASIRDKRGSAFYPSAVFGLFTLNVIYNLMFGERFEAGDETEVFLRAKMRDFVDSVNPLFDIFPLMVHLPKYSKYFASLPAKQDEFNEFFRGKIQKCEKRQDMDDGNFVAQFIKKAGSEYNEGELVYILRDFVSAGTETVDTQLCWAVILLGNNPKVLARLQTELDTVVPNDRLPSMDDKAKLPLMEATILKIMRVRTIGPLGLPHVTLCDTELSGYKIPANTMVYTNLWSADMDPTVWQEPEKFQPERFLDENKTTIKNKDKLSNFSFGKRACPGEILAHQEMFLFLSALVQKFYILPPEGETNIKDEMNFGDVLYPTKFEVRFVPRA